jgi:TM2 domain-containing membrane protein YozV
MVHCRACGKEIHELARVCPQCGAPQPTGGSDRRILPAFLLCWFLGWTGAHRFYVGKIGTGILMLFTVGVFGVLWLIDFIMIILGAFTDKAGNKITEWV